MQSQEHTGDGVGDGDVRATAASPASSAGSGSAAGSGNAGGVVPGVDGLQLSGKLRMTKQRREVYEVLLADRDHPTAAEVYERSRARMHGISLATVYNCLDTLTEAGFVRTLTVDRGPARYCPNLAEHAHFLCDVCGQVFDIEPATATSPVEAWRLPDGATTRKVDTVLHGRCQQCANDANKPATES